MSAIPWIAIGVLAAGSLALMVAAGLLAGLLTAWSERPVRIPVALQSSSIGDIRHAPTRDWLRSHGMVLEALGFVPLATHLADAGARPGRAAVSWFGHPGTGTLALLEASPHGHAITFQDRLGPERRETTSSGDVLTLRGRDLVERRVRSDLTDPMFLLRDHEGAAPAVPSPEATSAPAPPPGSPRPASLPSPEDLAAELQAVYGRVVDGDVARGWRVRFGRVAQPTLRGRMAAVGRELARRGRRIREEIERD